MTDRHFFATICAIYLAAAFVAAFGGIFQP